MAEKKKIKIKTKHHIYGRTQNCAGISALASLKAASATDLQIAVVLQVLSHTENKWGGMEMKPHAPANLVPASVVFGPHRRCLGGGFTLLRG